MVRGLSSLLPTTDYSSSYNEITKQSRHSESGPFDSITISIGSNIHGPRLGICVISYRA